MKIFVFSNIAFKKEEAPTVSPCDLLIFLNKASNISHYRDHFNKIVYHRSPDSNYGDEIMGCLNKYVFGAGEVSINSVFINKLKESYDWDYTIEKGKTKSMTTGYMVVKFLQNKYPDSEIILVNFGYEVKNSTYRCPWHNWRYENEDLSTFKHIYTNVSQEHSQILNKSRKKKIYYELSGWLGDQVYATAVIANVVSSGICSVNIKTTIPALWENCDILDKTITKGNADLVIKEHNIDPWDIDCRHIIEGTTNTFGYDTGFIISTEHTRPIVWCNTLPNRLIDEPYVLFRAGWQPSAITKKWARSYWEKLIELCPEIKFVQVGKTSCNEVPIPGAVNCIDKTEEMRDLFTLVRDSELVISPPSGIIHIAGAFKKPNILLAGGREPSSLNAYPETISFSSCGGSLECCKSKGCHKNQFNKDSGCSFFETDNSGECTAKCMLDITPEDVADSIKKNVLIKNHNAL